jgi:hypothetical protein
VVALLLDAAKGATTRVAPTARGLGPNTEVRRDWLTVHQAQTAKQCGAVRFMSQQRIDVALATSANSGILIELDDRPGADMTARLLLALTALYAQRPTHTVEEQRQYVELALRLIDKVEAATRAAVARILQRHPDAPAEVVERLGGGHSSRDCDPQGAPLSAQDQHSSGDQYFDSHPPSADDSEGGASCCGAQSCSIPRPPPPNPPHEGEGSRVNAAPNAMALLHAGEAKEGAFGEAFFAASPAERRRLMSLITRGGGDDVQAPSVDGERLHGKVDAAALQGQTGEFTREFAQLIDSPNSLCERIVNDPWGEPMVVAAKAAGMPIAILQHILLLVSASASYSVERVYDLTELYHGLDGRAARDLLAQWRAQAKLNDPTAETGHNTDRKPDPPRPPPYAHPHAGERRVGVSLRSRFGDLTERLRSQSVNARRDRGRDLILKGRRAAPSRVQKMPFQRT